MDPQVLWLVLGGLAVLAMSGAVVYEMAFSHGQPLGQIAVRTVDGVLMEVSTGAAYLRMKAAAARDGVTLRASSGFRSMAEQEQLYQEHLSGSRPTPVARPGYSNHQSGIAIDIHVGGNSRSSPEYQWLEQHAAEFGFVNTGASFSSPEWWHWEHRA